ncbi:MAG: AAA family ATPase [Clostridia bacterium]
MNYEKQTEIPKLQTVTATTLLNTEFPPLQFAVDEILPQGIFILAGSGKIGKSWLALDMCVSVATGANLWTYKTSKGEVLYLALEDNHRRLKNRLSEIHEDNEVENLHFATASCGISDGLIEQVDDFMIENPNTRLIIIDTLEHIRNTNTETSIYSHDYQDIQSLRAITESHDVTILLIHHTRKMYDPDPLNMLTGSTGLVGAVDGVWVLEKEKRTGNEGKLTIVNRDTNGYCFKVEFDKDNFKWNCLGSYEEEKAKSEVNFCEIINDFLNEKWQGTSKELASEITTIEISPPALTKKLNKMKAILLAEFGIRYSYERTKDKRIINLFREKVTDDTADIHTPLN